MAYDDIYIEFKCDSYGTPLRWAPKGLWQKGYKVNCPKCKDSVLDFYGESAIVPHVIRIPEPPLPKIPSTLYIGPKKTKRVKITPLPLHQWKEVYNINGEVIDFTVSGPIPEEIQPYSIRSFLIQLSLIKDFPCKYFVRGEGKDTWGNIIWDEKCWNSIREDPHPCHLVNGWMHGEESCEGWEYIAKNLCQSEKEALFLHQYLRVNKDRESPMPIPQAHIEVTEKVRVDFVMFIPITRFDWKWLAIEIDSKKYHDDEAKDFEKNMTMQSQGYEVLRLSTEKMMLDQVRELYKKVCSIQNAGKEKANSVRKTFYTNLSE